MDISWETQALRLAQLPQELFDALHTRDDAHLLLQLSRAALDRKYTDQILVNAESLIPHCCASFSSESDDYISVLAAFGRLLPFAPHLAEFAENYLRKLHDSGALPNELNTSYEEYLLALYRLLQFDHQTFVTFVPFNVVQAFLQHGSGVARYLAIRVLCQYLRAADAAMESMIVQHVGERATDGPWEDRNIDYRFLSLWEEQRTKDLGDRLNAARQAKRENPVSQQRIIPADLLHPSTACISGVLLPRLSAASDSTPAPIVGTPTILNDLRALAQTLTSPRPILLTGLAGSGKTLLVRHAARQLDKSQSMVTLHLNEQSDAKLLIGMYTTGSTPGSFTWQPGVLTTAVLEGRWVFIEDLDRAPNEIISTLLPLIERRELVIPSRGQTISAARGFRIVATMRTTLSTNGQETKPSYNLLGARHWQNVHVQMPRPDELKAVILGLFPALHEYAAQFVTVFEQLQILKQYSNLESKSKTGLMRAVNPRDLFKWCARVSSMIGDKSTFTASDLDQIFLDAVDCFAGALPESAASDALTACIAQNLQIDPQRRDHLLRDRTILYKADSQSVRIGRNVFSRQQRKTITGVTSKRPFSTNAHTLRLMDRVSVAIAQREPLLLVGETGTGKTTSIQHLADQLGKKLVAFNLSQQSESGDLLGGFKPVNARSLIVPMKDEFDDLFSATFSYKRNAQFLEMLNKCMAKSQWIRVCKLWTTALGMVEQQRLASLQNGSQSPARKVDGQPHKKRKVEPSMSVATSDRWDKFAENVKGLEHRLNAGGQEAFAFAFVEGNIVKAVRNGDWVLLDEINLASPDTLEALADLFDPSSPSIMLSEAGSVEVIKAHPAFRVFAAMNPATDVGKKDLPLGIRSRFTELYVESPDRDFQSLLSIVTAYLGKDADMDKTVSADVCHLHQAVQSLNERNLLADGAGQKPHFSLRTLTRALTYAKDVTPLCPLRRALFEGFQMSFSTLLDKESEARLLPLLHQHLFSKLGNAAAVMKKPLLKPADSHPYVREGQYWLRQGPVALEDQPHYIITPFIRRNLDNLIRASFTRRFPVLIQGPTSAGKTSMIEYLAKRSGNKFVRINNHEHTDLQEYLGTYVSGSDGRLTFQEGVLVKALREGHWVVLDELNLAPTDVLEALNRLLDDNRELLIPETQEIVRPHENFMLFATQNPAGLYGGRKVLSRAFRNRFLELHFDDIPVDELNVILEKRTGIPPSWCKKIVKVYRELSVLRQEERVFEQKSFATLRDLFRWALRNAATQEELAMHGFMLLAERVRKPEEREAVKKIIEKVMGPPKIVIDEAKLYGESSNVFKPYLEKAVSRGVVWTNAMRRLYVLVATAIQNNEPVLLVGETGCGKTTVVQMLGDAFNKELGIVNAHQNTETGDLIGAQRPLRNRAGIEQQIREALAALPYSEVTEALPTATIEEVLVIYDTVKMESNDPYIAESQAQIESNRPRLNALFEWADGSLVHAMKTGQYFLLDEISLADDSVLERLNSVLEPSRSLLLAEKGSLDSFVEAQAGFQFFATMNPGGDYGKRELSPALRNRFTEIWVPALSDMDDILMIVQSKLKADAAAYAQILVDFAQWFNKRYNTSAASSISIRDTLAWVDFINQQANTDPIFSVIHGAAMVYIDTLGANPAALLAINPGSVNHERSQCLAELSRLVKVNAADVYNASIELQLTQQTLTLGAFTLPVVSIDEIQDEGFTFLAPTTKSNAMRVVRALQLRKPILLEGSPGVGKTTLVTALASATGHPLTRINLSEQTDLMDLFGSDVPVEGASAGTFAWRDAPFLRAMKAGEWVLLDEMNLASQSVLEGLNACLDHRGEVYISELDQTFSRHPSFRLFAAQNPHHQGGGRKGLPASFVNRFTVVYADVFQPTDLLTICRKSFPQLTDDELMPVVSFIEKLDSMTQTRQIGALGAPWEFNLRDTLRWLGLVTSEEGLLKGGKQAADFLSTIISQRFRTPKDRKLVEALFAEVTQHVDANRKGLFHNLAPQHLQVGFGLLSRNALMAGPSTESMDIGSNIDYKPYLPVLESVMIAIQKRWPVLLVGPTGAGKTALLEKLAGLVGAEMITFSMNSDVDSMDLVGGYEQTEPQRAVHAFLERLSKQIEGIIAEALAQRADAEIVSSAQHVLELTLQAEQALASTKANANGTLLQIAEKLSSFAAQTNLVSTVTALVEEAVALANTPAQVDRAQFSWQDGTLVRALEQGKWLVLDNANLCSPAVLDRLNSLLEPNGTLIINEHTDAQGMARTIRPAEGFRIFFTCDPKYGELSRALRNRAVEICLLPQEEHDSGRLPLVISTESRMHRLRNAGLLAQQSVEAEDVQTRYLSDIIADHLAGTDLPLLQAFLGQVQGGLYDVPVALLQEAFTKLMTLKNTYSLASSNSQDALALQTINPLNNAPLVLSTAVSQDGSPELVQLSRLQELELDVVVMEQALISVSQRQVPRREQTKLQRSATAGKAMGQKDFTVGIFPFLQNFVHVLREILQRGNGSDVEHLKAYRRFWWALLRLVDQRNVDEAVFASYLEIGGRLSQHAQITEMNDGQGSASQVVEAQFVKSIAPLLSTTQTPNAGTMIALWRFLRENSASQTPQTYSHVIELMELEKLADTFDTAAFKFDNVSVAQVMQLREAFTKAIGLVVSGATKEAGELINGLKEAMDGLASPAVPVPVNETWDEDQRYVEIETVLPPPHFARQFEALCQLFEVAPTSVPTELAIQLQKARVLALQPTKYALPFDSTNEGADAGFKALGHFVGFYNNSKQPLALTEDVHSSILSSLESTDDVPLSRLGLLRTEVEGLTQLIAGGAHYVDSDRVQALNIVLRRLCLSVAKALDQESEEGSIQEWATWASSCVASDSSTAIDKPVRAGGNSIEGRATVLLTSCIEYLNAPPAAHTVHAAATAWLQFSLALLMLYTPTRPFDPALRPLLEREMHQSATADIATRLSALHRFYALAGQYSHLRVAEIETEKVQLGEEPAVITVPRPPGGEELARLQGEFSALLRALGPLLEASGSSGDAHTLVAKAIDPTVKLNVSMVKVRLGEGYRGYADITGPVLGFLHALEVGVALAANATKNSESLAGDDAAVVVQQMTPLLASRPAVWRNEQASALKGENSSVRLHALASFATVKGLLPSEDPPALAWSTVHTVFDTFYQQWKVELRAGQQDTAQKGSLYHYRGDAEYEDEIDEDEYRQLFPDYDGDAVNGEEKDKTSQKVQQLSPQLADALHAIFKPGQTGEENVLALMKNATSLLDTSASGKENSSLTPLLLLILQDKTTLLDPSTFNKQTYNIYTSPNLTEADNLIVLTKRIQSRFTDIRAIWPEHATLIDVLRTCTEVLAFPYTSPVAKFLTKVEKLHAYVHEWQVVASKEFSAQQLYDDLTNMIVKWRQLELSTWARMLDMETSRCEEDAKSWFFVAWENIVGVPLILVNALDQQGVDLKTHVRELVKTLEGFFASTGLGQFSARLNMLDDFVTYVRQRAETTTPALGVVHVALSNFIAYMRPYEPLVAEALKKGRAGLEKKMKEVIQLASWKDTNIDALRQSAKASHRRLFKTIRKFRDLLGQPAGAIFGAGLPDIPLFDPSTTSLVLRKIQAAINDEAKELCNNRLGEAWTSRPARFKNLVATINVMVSKASIPQTVLDSAADLHVWIVDTEALAQQLRKATPQILNDETKETVKHLKSRKRKLFADTLKELRNMGFKSNLSSDTLARQDSLQAVLAGIPALERGDAGIKEGEKWLHRLLHVMPKVREAGREHSDDLTGAEVARSMALCESMLFVAVQQRNTLGSAAQGQRVLENLLAQVENIWGEGQQSLDRDARVPVNYGVEDAICCLPSIIAATSRIVRTQANLARLDCSVVLDGLDRAHKFWDEKRGQWLALARLPTRLTSSKHAHIYDECTAALQVLTSDITLAIQQHPQLGATLSQIQIWATINETHTERKLLNGTQALTIEHFSRNTCDFIDATLGSVQDLEKPLAALPSSAEDPSWLVTESQSLSTALKSLRLPYITNRLDELLRQLEHLSDTPESLNIAAALLHIFHPLLLQYREIAKTLTSRLTALHTSTAQTSYRLAKLFATISRDGFCTPSDKSANQDNQGNEKLEGGTGLGEGEGGEDISKDIAEDEDLEDLAMEKDERDGKEEIEDEKDAVDMGDQDMEGEMGDAETKEDEEGEEGDEGEQEDMEEEVGDVDDLGPSTVDEKMWDEGGKEDEKEKEGEKGQGVKDEENVGAAEEEGGEEDKKEKDEEGDEEEAEEVGAEELEQEGGKPQDEIEKTDPHLQEEQNLDLPDDIDMDGQDEDEGNESGMEDMGDADMGEDEQKDLPETEGEVDEAGGEEDPGTPDIPEDGPVDLDAQQEQAEDGQDEDDAEKTQEAGEDAEEEQGEEEEKEEEGLLQDNRQDDSNTADEVAPSEAQGAGVDDQQVQEEQKDANAGAAQQESGTEAAQPEQQQVAGAEGERGQAQQDQAATGEENTDESQESLPFKKIGDALEKWYKQQKQIQDAQADQERRQDKPDIDMADAEFEHVQDEADEHDAQALGAANEDQAKAIDEDMGLPTNENETREDFAPDQEDAEPYQPEDVEMQEPQGVDQEEEPSEDADNIPNAFVGEPQNRQHEQKTAPEAQTQDEADVEEVDNRLTSTHLDSTVDGLAGLPELSLDEARQIYTTHENSTRNLSLLLAEHLRLILAPTQATKMRGDFRTGKRLNIKRIIPYIASQYKRDKIWMRRSVPSKRSYQIMLAIDDSKSMAESGSSALAFETMALVARALTVLESGELSIVGFGDDVTVAHEFGQQFTSEAGAEVVRRFAFEQTRTNVRRLVERSLDLFREARLKASGTSQELWQLQLIVSDGVCEDHPGIRQLVRQAQEERIMIVFVIVDAAAANAPSTTPSAGAMGAKMKSSSILDLQTAEFGKDEITGEMRVKTVKYLDTFPFGYYLVVRDVMELPGVLAGALRQWFAEVVETA